MLQELVRLLRCFHRRDFVTGRGQQRRQQFVHSRLAIDDQKLRFVPHRTRGFLERHAIIVSDIDEFDGASAQVHSPQQGR